MNPPQGLNPNARFSVDRVSHVERRAITMALAKQFQNLERVPGERALKPSRLKKLKDSINNGKQLPFYWCDCFCCANDRTYLTNGQHSSALMVNGDIPAEGTAIITHYICETLDEVINLWSMIDDQSMGRTKTEVISSMVHLNPEFAAMPLTLIQSIGNALCIAKMGSNYSDLTSHNQKAQVVLQHSDFVHWCHSLFPATETYAKVGVIYAAYITYNIDKERATLFWTEVVKAIRLDEGSPSLALHNRLLQGYGYRREKNSVQWHDFSNLCLCAWRAWRDGKRLFNIVIRTDGMKGLERFVTQEKSGAILDFRPSKNP